jgi:exodeoxyribonuclease VII small subunit
MEQPKSFENATARLETIVETLEKGEIPLEEAIDLFREGQTLLAYCQKKLTEAETKLKVLGKDSTGNMVLKDAPNTGNSTSSP